MVYIVFLQIEAYDDGDLPNKSSAADAICPAAGADWSRSRGRLQRTKWTRSELSVAKPS